MNVKLAPGWLAATLLLSGCESFDPHNIQNWEPLEWFQEEDPAIAEAARRQAAREAYAAALVAANPRWRDYEFAWRNANWKDAAAVAADFKLDALSESDLGQLAYVLGKADAPRLFRERVSEEQYDRRYPGWLALRAAAAPAFAGKPVPASAAPLAARFAYLAERPYRSEADNHVLTFARQILALTRDSATEARIAAALVKSDAERLARSDAERDAYARARREAAEKQRLDEEHALRLAAIAARRQSQPGSGVGEPPAREQRRCASCLGSGKAGYVLNQKTYQQGADGKAVQVADAPCSRCNGTGYHD